MSTELKFRAWDLTSKTMLPDVGFHPSLQSDLSHEDEYYKTHLEGRYIISPKFTSYRLMQFTGIKTDSGEEVYDGDIGRVWLKDNVLEEGGSWWYYEVKKIKGCWCMLELGFDYSDTPMDEIELLHTTDYKIEIIGNIYKLPECLKNQK